AYERALRDYRKATELQPDNETATFELAELLGRVKRFSEAVGYWEKAYQRRPRDARVLLGLGYCRRNLSDTKEAVVLLRRLLELHPNTAPGWAELGQAHFEEGRPVEAEDCLRRALRLAPHDRGAAYTLALCLQQQEGKQDEAKKWLGRWKELEAAAQRKDELLKATRK